MVTCPMMANSRWCSKMLLTRVKGALVANHPGYFVARIVVMNSLRLHRRSAGWNYGGKGSRKLRHKRSSNVSVASLLNNTASPLTIIIERPA
mgnify:CR=1 FL=1